MFPAPPQRHRAALSLSGPRECGSKITPDAATITSPLCPWLFSGLPEHKRPISKGMSLLLAAHGMPSGRAAHGAAGSAGMWVLQHPGVGSGQQPWAGSCHGEDMQGIPTWN